MRALLLVTAALAGCDRTEPLPIPETCNGHVELCDRRYDQVSYATTHNAMSNADDAWEHPNQPHGLARQLDDGVRAVMLDTHEWDGEALLCHGLCPLGSLPLVDGLTLLREFLDTHRGEVVTIIFESYASPEDTAAAFAASGLDRYVHAHAPGAAWPTLRELIDADERLIVFTDDGGDADWYLDVWAHAWETDYAASTTDDFSCDPNRGAAGNPLFIFNHFLTRTFPVPEEAATVNANPFLIDRARGCAELAGALPNFVTVDFYTTGDVLAAVDQLNGV